MDARNIFIERANKVCFLQGCKLVIHKNNSSWSTRSNNVINVMIRDVLNTSTITVDNGVEQVKTGFVDSFLDEMNISRFLGFDNTQYKFCCLCYKCIKKCWLHNSKRCVNCSALMCEDCVEGFENRMCKKCGYDFYEHLHAKSNADKLSRSVD